MKHTSCVVYVWICGIQCMHIGNPSPTLCYHGGLIAMGSDIINFVVAYLDCLVHFPFFAPSDVGQPLFSFLAGWNMFHITISNIF